MRALLGLLVVVLAGCPGGPPGIEPPDEMPSLDDDDATDDDDQADDDDEADDDDAIDDDDAGPPVEARALWVTRWDYSSAADVEDIFETAAGGGFNVIFFQVRGRADAYYESTWEPWASRLSGTLGQDPGWDPLQEAIDAGASHGVQVHAWLNTFPAWSGWSLPSESEPRHPLLDHPDWLVADESGDPMDLNDSYVFFSPGNPEVQAWIAAVAGDICDRYAVDGIHLDYVRYPGPQYSHDDASEAEYAASGGALSWEDWQREQVTATVAGVKAAIEASRPGTLLTAAVWGIYEDLWSWHTSQGNIDYYQDSLAMVDVGALDVAVPMIYWPLTDPPGQYTDYATLVNFFGDQLPPDALWAGMSANYSSFAEIEGEIEAARAAGATGHALFALSSVDDHDWWDELAAGPFADEVSPP